jgi:hypothetical protein
MNKIKNKIENLYNDYPEKFFIAISIIILFFFFIIIGIITINYSNNNTINDDVKVTKNLSNDKTTDNEVLEELNNEIEQFKNNKEEINLSQFPVWGESKEDELKKFVELFKKNYIIKKDSMKITKKENNYELNFLLNNNDNNIIFNCKLEYNISSKMFKIILLEGKFE